MKTVHDNAQLALDTILHKPTKGIATWLVHVMEHRVLERIAGAAGGEYRTYPVGVYVRAQKNMGVCMIDQFIPDNPLKMGSKGYERHEKGPTGGAAEIRRNDVLIDSPEAVCEHLERFVFPSIHKAVGEFDEDACIQNLLETEVRQQAQVGPEILKVPYGTIVSFPTFRYTSYGYANYFMAYALYPEVIEKDFSLQADIAVLRNRAAARAFTEGQLPPLVRLDHDMADSRGMLVDIKTLDRIWLPHLSRSLQPMLGTNVRMIWHCDGNLMALVPRLLEAGIKGFQGFQYEDGMDYERICRMKSSDNQDLTIIAGVSVTRTLPMGGPDDVRREMKWLVENGPPTGLFLGCSSSMAPGVSWENIQALIEGLQYYRTHGR